MSTTMSTTMIECPAITNEVNGQSMCVPRGLVKAELNFFDSPKDGSVPFQYGQEPPGGMPWLNYGQPAISVDLFDIRGHENEFSLDKDAFQVLQNVLSTVPYDVFLSDDAIKKDYYPHVERLLLENVKGVHRVIVFDHVVRMESQDKQQKPLHTAHADQTAKAAAKRVRLSVSDEKEAQELLAGRYRIINVWKPLKGPVQSCPLAYASGSTVNAEDLVPIEFRLPHRTGEIVGVRFDLMQKWYYWSSMETDECVLLKCNDTNNAVAMQVPHSAFHDPRTRVGAPGRESIEARALVFG